MLRIVELRVMEVEGRLESDGGGEGGDEGGEGKGGRGWMLMKVRASCLLG